MTPVLILSQFNTNRGRSIVYHTEDDPDPPFETVDIEPDTTITGIYVWLVKNCPIMSLWSRESMLSRD